MSPRASWRECPVYLYGCDLYNHGYWWEAHATWEQRWRLCDRRSPEGRFLKGLIQASTVHLLRETGKLRAARTVAQRAERNLAFVLKTIGHDRFRGLDVAAWLDQLRRCVADLQERPEGPRCVDPNHYPYLVLETG
jgi:hypothetical protein